GNATDQLQSPIDKEASYDPFNIYDILNKRNKDAGNIEQNEDVLDEMIKVGQTMGFTMDECANDLEKIIGSQGVHETKVVSVSDMEVKYLWGNSFFDFTISEALGNSGGILCAWDPNIFYKEHHRISDNFIALYGTWRSNHTKLLFISVYAPQTVSGKRSLWLYLASLINRWNGESIVLGDFNEVRRKEDRWGSTFNVYGARVFNNFIDTLGLIEEKVQWAVEGDEKSKFFHGIVNKKRANLAVKGVMIDGEWVDEPGRVK
nr:RNA-directed DNA polymerase, eukaryota [Tanacetum cinerariifolium]